MPPVEKFEFTRNWNNPSDFPTYEPDEAKVRADMQALPDELKTYLNEKMAPAVDEKVPGSRTVNGHPLTDDVKVTKEDVGLGKVDNTPDAEKPVSQPQQEALDAKADKTDVLQKDNATPYTPTQPYHPATKDYTDKAVAGAVMGQVPDGSITDKKLANDSVTEEKLSPGIRKSVTEDFPNHIADKTNPHGVTAEQVPYDNSRTELASETTQGAIDELYARMYGDLKVQVQVYETGTTTPISGVIVTGVVSETGGVCYANEDGIAIGYILSDAESATATVKVGTDYIDLTGQTSQQVTVKKGVTANATIYATRVSNPSGKIETFTASTQKMFTNAVKRVDVHCLGGGMGGFSGRGSYGSYEDEDGDTSYTYIAEGGNGGKGGYNSYKLQVAFTPNAKFDIVVGGAGTGGSSPGSSSSSQLGKGGTRGGASNCLGVIANGGDYYPTGGAVAATSAGYPSAANADTASSSTDHLFGDSSLELVGGGNGGGGAASTQHFASGSSSKSASNGGSPYGGNGSGGDARGRGGGGAGGSASVRVLTSGTTYSGTAGGDGGPGAVYVRWFYS